MQHMGVREDVAQSLERGEGKVGRRHLESETLADQAPKLGLVLKCIHTGNDAAGAVAKQENRQSRFSCFRSLRNDVDVADIIGEGLDVETLAVGLAASTQVNGINREAARDELLGCPSVVTAVRVEAGNDDDNAAQLARRTPRSKDNSETADASEFFSCGFAKSFSHGVSLMSRLLAPHGRWHSHVLTAPADQGSSFDLAFGAFECADNGTALRSIRSPAHHLL